MEGITAMATPLSKSSCTIYPRTFSDSTADAFRDRWTQAKMHHVIQAVGDTHVVLELDKGTGHTVIGVKLLGVRPNPYGGLGQVLIDYCHEDGSDGRVLIRLEDVGVVLPLEATNAKWDAIKSHRELVHAGVVKAQAEHGDVEGRSWGKWDAVPLDHRTVMVTYTPHTGNPAFADKWGERGYWHVTVEEVA